jgi:hypothetical protein
MLEWIKKLYKRYERFTLEQYDVSPVVYKIGTKKYIKVKKFSKGPVPRTRYQR